MIERLFAALSRLFGKPHFWFAVVFGLFAALVVNLLTRGRFDPGMSYSNFIQNWLQVLALAVSCVATVSLVRSTRSRDNELHGKIDAIHEKLDDR